MYRIISFPCRFLVLVGCVLLLLVGVQTPASGQTFTFDAAASGNNGGVSGASGSINVSVTAGELVEANCEAYGGSASNTLSDSLGNTWHQAIGLTNPGELSEWYSVIAHGGSDTIQCQGSSGTSFVELGTVGEVSSTGWPASPLDQANAVYFSTASSCNVSTPSATSQAIELAIAGCATAGGVVGSASGWTVRQQWASNSGAFFDSALSSTGIVNFNPPANGASQEFPWITTFIPNPSSGGGAPSVTNVSPNSAAVGTSVTITGTNFGSSQGSSTVKFNGTSGSPTSWSTTSIAVPVPSGATTGSVVVTVGGVASNGWNFTVQATPNISGITPSTAAVGTSVTITGTNFGSSQGSSTVKFNGTSGSPTSWSTTSIAVPVPSGATTGSVVVTVGGVASNGYNFVVSPAQTFTYDAAASGNNGGVYGASSTISVSVTAGELVEANCETFGGSSNNTVSDSLGNTWHLATSITTTSLAQVEEWYSVIAHGGSDTIQCQGSSGTSFVELGTVGEVSSTGWPASPLDQANAVYFSTASSCNVSTPSATSQAIELAIAGCATAGGVVGSASGWTVRQQWASNSGAFFDSALSSTGIVNFNPPANGASQEFPWITTFIPNPSSGGGAPSVTNVTPGSGTTAGGTSVTITGTGFVSGATVTFGTALATNPTVSSSTTMTATTPAHAAGSVTVSVTNPNMQSGSKAGAFSYTNPPPTVSLVTPRSGTTAGGTSVTITGTGFLTGATVTFNGAQATNVIVSNSTTITATTPAQPAGSVTVAVTNTDTQAGSTANLYTYNVASTIGSMSPTQGGIGLAVQITGTNMGTSCSVTFNGIQAAPWSCTPTLITVPVPLNATSGNVEVTVSGGQGSAGSFTVTSPYPATAIEYSYDAMGRVIQTMTCTPMNCGTGGGTPMNYNYDLAGNLASLTSYGGTTINYSPADSPIDGAGRVTKVESSWVDAQHPATLATFDPSLGYWPTGASRKVTLGNSLTEASVYNNRVQPCRINVNSSGALLSTCSDALPTGNVQDFTVTFNSGADNGNVARFTAAGQQNFNRSYTYDSLNRIHSMSAPGDVCSGLSWTIDPWGNRLAQTATGGSCYSPTVQVNRANQLAGAPYTGDAAGNVTGDGNHTYAYDAENRIATVDGGGTATYVYDALGNRAEKAAGTDEQYLRDINGEINTVFANGAFQRMYVYLGGKQLAEYYQNTTYFSHTDNLGSTRLMTQLNQTICESDDYYPYGETITTGICGILKFTGKERDTESSLDYFGARHYASSMGRFMTADQAADETIPVPLPFADFRNPQSLNLYSYGLNNPVSNVDPDGHDVHVCVDNSSGGQNCFNMSDKDYANLQQQQNGQNGINMPGGSMPGGNITCGGQVCGSATFFEPGLQDTSLDVAMFIGGVASTGRGLIEGGLGLLRGAGEAGAGTAAREAGVALAEKTVVSGGKAAIRDALENGAVNELQKQAVKRALARGAAGDTFTLTKLADGSIKVTTEVAGRAGGRAVYEKIVDAAGQTTSVVQRAYDASGSLVHVDPKLQ